MHRTLVAVVLALALALALVACSSSGNPSPPPPIENTGSSDMPKVDERTLAVTGLVPATGDELGGTMVRIRGRRFMADGSRSVKVYFGNVPAQVLRFEDDGTLVVQAPGGKLGPPVEVTVYFEPGGVFRLPGAFTFTTSPP